MFELNYTTLEQIDLKVVVAFTWTSLTKITILLTVNIGLKELPIL